MDSITLLGICVRESNQKRGALNGAEANFATIRSMTDGKDGRGSASLKAGNPAPKRSKDLHPLEVREGCVLRVPIFKVGLKFTGDPFHSEHTPEVSHRNLPVSWDLKRACLRSKSFWSNDAAQGRLRNHRKDFKGRTWVCLCLRGLMVLSNQPKRVSEE